MFRLFLSLALYLPFQLAINPTEGIDLASIRVFILLLATLWLSEGLRTKKALIKGGFQSVIIVFFLFLSFLSIIMAKNTDWSTRKLLFLFSVFPIYFVAVSIINSKEKLLKVSKALVISGTAAAAIGIVQFFSQFIFGLKKVYNLWADFIMPPFLGHSLSKAVTENPSWLVNVSGRTYLRSTSLFPDPHMFSFFLGMLIPVSLGLFLRDKRKIYLVFFAILTIADILTFSRGGYLGLFSGVTALFVFSWKKISLRFRIATMILVLVAGLALLVPSPISSRFFSSFNLKEGSNKGRIEMWQKAWEVTKDSPFLGVGIGNYPLEVKASADYREPIYAHNTYLDISAETGIAAAILWLALILFTLVKFINKSKEDVLFLYFAVGLIIFSVHSLVETGIYSPVVLTLFLILVSFSQIDFNHEKNS